MTGLQQAASTAADTMGNDNTDGRPRKGFHPTEAHRRKYTKNIAVLLALAAVCALLYFIGVVKIMEL